jgi:hypothetical protein
MKRIMNTPLNIDARGSSVRVVVAADNYSVAHIAEGMNDRLQYAKLFAASPKLLEALEEVVSAWYEDRNTDLAIRMREAREIIALINRNSDL